MQFPDLPRKIINLKFQKLKLNLERQVFRQLLKVKTFLSVGTFNDNIKDLSDEISRDLPDQPLEEVGKNSHFGDNFEEEKSTY